MKLKSITQLAQQGLLLCFCLILSACGGGSSGSNGGGGGGGTTPGVGAKLTLQLTDVNDVVTTSVQASTPVKVKVSGN